MPISRQEQHLRLKLAALKQNGMLKERERVIRCIIPADDKRGPRYLLEGCGDRPFLRMNANTYLGMSLRKEVVAAEEEAAGKFGAGPGAVRFISGTFTAHVALEKKLAAFHRREAAMIFSSAYAAVMGVITPLIDEDTIVLSDALNHNCIINAIRLSRPKDKGVYRHLDMSDLEKGVKRAINRCRHLFIVTDGIFSMRGDHAPLNVISDIAAEYDHAFERGINVLVDDSHGVGAFGATGRGTEEVTQAERIDMLIATLGKSLGVNGGYIAAGASVIDYLRQTSPFYVYSNPITPSEAAASLKALDILDSDSGRSLLTQLRQLTLLFETGLNNMGFEIIASEHPIVPVMIRNTEKTATLVRYLFDNNILATGLTYPVVPQGDEEIRFQVSVDHTEADIQTVLEVLKNFMGS
jgi:glycine C-acetyltransferase